MTPPLSILIATLPQRVIMFNGLLAELANQAKGFDTEILSDSGIGTVGAKRQRLLQAAKGAYICYIDDDDWITPDYLREILNALQSEPDAVGFRGWITTNGKKPKDFSISMLHEYTERHNMYFRFHNHLSPVRREIALSVGFKDMSYGEDHDYATRLRPLIKTEVYIDKKLYHYRYITKK
jgi:glycosyltransferase involved in cell wall biosynthesis